ncbi:Cyclin-A2-1 [Zostera marina]|uniref:Cyclin-A2-1 n=1 Tax=Zostera marina TaxID=29655 RepID=A0A0K9NVD9_ZOSMR|nr:Cyclin-A2-1 [Zostera marina]
MNKAITFVGGHNQLGRITRSRSRAMTLCEPSARTDSSKSTTANSLAKRRKSKLSLGNWSNVNDHSNKELTMIVPSKRKQLLKHITNVPPKNITAISGSKRPGTALTRLNTGKKSKSSSFAATGGLPSNKKIALNDVTNRVSRNVSKICHGNSTKDLCIATAPEPKKLTGIKEASSKPNTATFMEMNEVNQKQMIYEECSGQKDTDNAHKMEDEKIDDSYHLEEKTEDDIVDIDSKRTDPQLCSPYAQDIYDNLSAIELDRRPYFNYMETMQCDVNQSMRLVLIDWLVEVCIEDKYVPDTLYLSINILDRFLSKKAIFRDRLQLLGVASLFIASKYEELKAPPVERFRELTANTYTSVDILEMEKRILKCLEFRISVPTTKTFLRRFLRAAQCSSDVLSLQLEYMANYLAELTLLEYDFLRFIPSMIAASAVFLAKWTLNPSVHPWNKTLEHYSRYKASDLKDTVFVLHYLQNNIQAFRCTAIYSKYQNPKFLCVANHSPQDLVPTLFS